MSNQFRMKYVQSFALSRPRGPRVFWIEELLSTFAVDAMLSNTLNPHTDAHIVRGRPTLKVVERFRNNRQHAGLRNYKESNYSSKCMTLMVNFVIVFAVRIFMSREINILLNSICMLTLMLIKEVISVQHCEQFLKCHIMIYISRK